jgi:hypothetical protein
MGELDIRRSNMNIKALDVLYKSMGAFFKKKTISSASYVS